LNDVFFGFHALVFSIFAAIQLFMYPSGGQKVSKVMLSLIIMMIAAIIGYGIFVLVRMTPEHVINYLYFLSYIKLFITSVKYIPQAYMNYARKSTKGWSIAFSLLDLTGGILSISQLIFDGWRTENWDGVRSNPLKFFLGLVSILFDLLFIFQHYILYPQHGEYARLRSEVRPQDHVPLLGPVQEDTKIVVRYGE